MGVNSQMGALGYGMQSAKGVLPTVWYRSRANSVNIGPVQDVRGFPLEVGGGLVPTGVYKAMAFFGGGAAINPRMQGDVGWLLKGLMGQCTSTPGTKSSNAVHAAFSVAPATINTGFTALPSARRVAFTVTVIVASGPAALAITGTCNGAAQTENLNIANGAVSTVTMTVKEYSTITSIVITGTATGNVEAGYYQTNSHVFKFNTDHADIPWMGFRKLNPGATAPDYLGEIGMDCKMAAMRFNVPQNGIITAMPTVLGREPTFIEAPAWTWADVSEDYTSVPLSCVVEGGVTLPAISGTELKIINLGVTMVNNLTSPQQEMVIGSYFPDDITVLSRAMSISAVLKWSDPDLYQRILTNLAAGTAWSPVVFTSDFRAVVKSPDFIPGSASIQHSLTFDAAKVAWTVPNSPELAGGDEMLLQLQGTVIEPASGEYATLTAVNEQYSY